MRDVKQMQKLNKIVDDIFRCSVQWV